MTNSELNLMLINKFSFLKEKYLDEVSWQEGDATGSHIVYGDVLKPYLLECIFKNKKSEVVSVFNFLEELLCIGEKYIDEVIAFSVFEGIIEAIKDKSDLTAEFGEKCAQIFQEVLTI